MQEKIMKKLRIGFVGRGTLGRDVLNHMVNNPNIVVPFIINCRTTAEVGAGRDVFESIATDKNIPFHFTNSLNSEKWVSYLQEQKLDAVVAMLWLDTINQDVISTTKMGFINLHGGLLPRYRGNACSNWAILNEEKEHGLSVHFMEPGKLDSGPIILQEKMPITEQSTIKELMDYIDRRGAEMVVDALQLLLNDEYTQTNQDETEAIRCYPRLPRDGEINWTDSAEEIERLIRAAGPPYPGAYSYYADIKDNGTIKKMTILSASVISSPTKFFAVPGHVIKLDEERRAVSCGNDKLLLLENISIDNAEIAPSNAFRTVRQRLGLDTETLLKEIRKIKEANNA